LTASTSTSLPARSTGSRPERRRQVDDRADADDAAAADRGNRPCGGYDVRKEGPKVLQIGAALQEAALDPLLTGDHLRLQTMLQVPRAERKPRQIELLDRVGLEGRPQGRRLPAG
jgi:hypothetical protein